MLRKLLLILFISSFAFGGVLKPPRGAVLNHGHPLSRGLAFFCLMNEGSGNKVYDLSGNGNTGTFTGEVSWVSGKFGSVLNFTENLSYITVPHSDSIDFADESMSWSMWFKTTTSQANGYMFTKNNGGAGVKWYGANLIVGTGIRCYFDDGATNSNVTTDDDYNDGQWHMLTCTRDVSSNLITVYVDGIYNNQAADNSGSLSNTGDMIIGHRNDLSATLDYIGDLDNFSIYNRALSDSEIAQLCREPFCMINSSLPVAMMYDTGIAPPAPGQIMFIKMSAIPVIIIGCMVVVFRKAA